MIYTRQYAPISMHTQRIQWNCIFQQGAVMFKRRRQLYDIAQEKGHNMMFSHEVWAHFNLQACKDINISQDTVLQVAMKLAEEVELHKVETCVAITALYVLCEAKAHQLRERLGHTEFDAAFEIAALHTIAEKFFN